LKWVEVEDRNRQRVLSAPGERELPSQHLRPRAPVGDAGEVIGPRKPVELVQKALDSGDEMHHGDTEAGGDDDKQHTGVPLTRRVVRGADDDDRGEVDDRHADDCDNHLSPASPECRPCNRQEDEDAESGGRARAVAQDRDRGEVGDDPEQTGQRDLTLVPHAESEEGTDEHLEKKRRGDLRPPQRPAAGEQHGRCRGTEGYRTSTPRATPARNTSDSGALAAGAA
jgi:hypothetical protein